MDIVWGILNYGFGTYYCREIYRLLSLFLDAAGDPTHDRTFDLEGLYQRTVSYADPNKVRAIIDHDSWNDTRKSEELMKVAVHAQNQALADERGVELPEEDDVV